jgi:hypothetical protein
MDSGLRRFNLPLAVILLVLLVLLGAGLRLYDLTDQPIDFHPTRQLRGAIVARGIYYEMLPFADEATRQQAMAFRSSTGQYEPSLLEFVVALTYLVLGKEVFWVARLYNIVVWLVGGLVLFALAQRMARNAISQKAHNLSVGASPVEAETISSEPVSWLTALIALAYYLLLPFSVQASRSFQPDPGMVMWIILSAYALYRWSETQTWKWALLAGLFAGMAVLTKAVAFYPVAATMLTMILFTNFTYDPSLAVQRNTLARIFAPVLKALRSPQAWCMAILMVAPTVLYYLGRQGRASEYFSSWTLALSHLLLQPRFYLAWLNLAQELLAWIALFLALAGLALSRRRNLALLAGLWVGYIAYGLFLPYQMNTHSYYHLQLIPIVALSMVPAVVRVVEWVGSRGKIWSATAAGLVLLVLIYASWQALIPLYRADYRHEPAYWQQIASYLPVEGKVVALTQDYGYRLMYYGWRKVTLWPNRGEIRLNILRGSQKEFEAYFAKRTADKSYFVITAFRQFDDQPELKQVLNERYPILAQGPGYLIYDLRHPKPGTDNSIP